MTKLKQFSKPINYFLRTTRPMRFLNRENVEGQLISKAKFSFEPKNERKYFYISALASKMGQIIIIMAHYHANSLTTNIIICILFLDSTYFREVGQKYRNIFFRSRGYK